MIIPLLPADIKWSISKPCAKLPHYHALLVLRYHYSHSWVDTVQMVLLITPAKEFMWLFVLFVSLSVSGITQKVVDWSSQLFEYRSLRLAHARSDLGPEIIRRILYCCEMGRYTESWKKTFSPQNELLRAHFPLQSFCARLGTLV